MSFGRTRLSGEWTFVAGVPAGIDSALRLAGKLGLPAVAGE